MRFLIWIAAATAVLAQQSQTPTKDAPKKARIEGVVVSLVGGPVPRAEVHLARRAGVQNGVVRPETNYAITTDDAGKFVIEEIDPGTLYTLGAQRPGFTDARYKSKSAMGPQAYLSLDAGQSLTGVTLTMTPQSVVTGKVSDADGDPVQGATVILGRRLYQRGGWQLVRATSASSNDLGDFRLANVSPGRYTFIVSLSQNPTAVSKSVKAMPVPTYYPDTTDPSGAVYIDIGPGQDMAGLDLRIKQSKVFTVRGHLAGDGGATGPITLIATPKVETNIQMIVQQPVIPQLLRSQTRVNEDGTFEFRNMLPGTYILQAVGTQAPGTRGLGSTELNLGDEDISNLVIPLSAPASIGGSIRLDDGDLQKILPSYDDKTARNTASTAVSAMFQEASVAGARVAIALTDASPLPITVRPTAAVKANGTFILENVAPSRYRLTLASMPPGTYVKSVRYGGVDVTGREFDIAPGGGGQFEIVLSAKAAEVKGIVVDEKGESPPATALCLWPQEADLGLINDGTRVLVADQNGQFDIRGLRPGTYYAAALEDTEWGIARERGYLILLTGDALKLDLSEGEKNSIQVKIIPVAKLKLAEQKLL